VHVPAGVDEVDVRVACHRERFTPSFSVSIPGAIAPIALFDLEEGSLSPKDLAQFIEDDLEWLPIAVIDPECGVLVRPIEIGDYVCWRRQGVRQRGKVKRIRHVATGEHVQAMTGFDPEPYHFELSRERENGTIEPSVTVAGDWRPEDVYLS
jgi:hypothetical protein